MTRAPYVMLKPGEPYDRGDPRAGRHDARLAVRQPADGGARIRPISLGETAEHVAERWSDPRERQDAFALESQRRAVAAIEARSLRRADSCRSTVPQRRATRSSSSRGRAPRAPTPSARRSRASAGVRARAARSRPATRRASTTARRRCSVVEPRGRAELGLRADGPRRRHGGRRASHPDGDGHRTGARPSARRSQRAGLDVADIDLVELNEAFASQSRRVHGRARRSTRRESNVNGGAIALGHPLGASGARLVTTLVHELRRTGGRYGLATMCIGVGQGIATVVERVEG